MIPGLAEIILKMASVDIELPDLHTTHIMTSSNGNIFCVTGPLSGEFTGYRWIPRPKASDAKLLMFSLICDGTSGWVNNQEAGDLRGHRAHYAATVMQTTASEVHASVVTEWPPACLHELLPKIHQSGNWRKPQMKDVSNLISICPTKPIQVWNLHGFFKYFYALQMIFLTWMKKVDVVTRSPRQGQEVF